MTNRITKRNDGRILRLPKL